MSGPIVIAAGGTGGHVFPAQGLAAELRGRGHRLVLMTDERGAEFSAGFPDCEIHRVSAGSVAGRGLIGRLRGVAAVLIGVVEARRLLRRLAPAAVVGFGGYASLPAVLAATRLGLPTVIHEQNAVLGRANRLLAPRVVIIATSFAETLGLRPSDREKVRHTGNPVRTDVAKLSDRPPPALGGPFSLVVFGGSQGAAVFGEIVPPALSALPQPLRKRLRVIQQCRSEQLDSIARHYRESDIAAQVAPFFDDMPARIAEAHLVVSRAGASTVAEITALGRAAIFVPYPYAIDDHQTMNAEAVTAAGAGWHVPQGDFAAEFLTKRVESFLRHGAELSEVAENARRMGRVDAARQLAKVLERLLSAGRQTMRFSEIAA